MCSRFDIVYSPGNVIWDRWSSHRGALLCVVGLTLCTVQETSSGTGGLCVDVVFMASTTVYT